MQSSVNISVNMSNTRESSRSAGAVVMYFSAPRGWIWGIIEDTLCDLADFNICACYCAAKGGSWGERKWEVWVWERAALRDLMHPSSCASTLWQPLQLDKPSKIQETLGFCQKCGSVLGMKLLGPGEIISGQGCRKLKSKALYCMEGEGSRN